MRTTRLWLTGALLLLAGCGGDGGGSSMVSSSLALASSSPEAVIDFQHGGGAKVTIKMPLVDVPQSTNPGDFTIEVTILDNRTGALHDTGGFNPTVVR